MSFLASRTPLRYRLIFIFFAIFILGVFSIQSMNKSGNEVAKNIQILAEQQLPKLDAIHGLQNIIKKLELALYRYYETTDKNAFNDTRETCQVELAKLLVDMDDDFSLSFKNELIAFDAVLSKFETEMSKVNTDWNLLRNHLAESRQISLSFEALVDNKQQQINTNFVEYRTATDQVVSNMITTQLKFSVFTFIIIIVIAVLMARQLKQHRINEELARYPNQNPYPILRFSNNGDALYANPAAEELAKSFGMENDLHRLVPVQCFKQSTTEITQPDSIALNNFKLGDRIFTTHIHHINDTNTFYAYLVDVTEQTKAEQELIKQSTHDILTGLPNRRLLESDLTRKTTTSMRPFGLILLKLSRLELINSSLGHQMTDSIYVRVSEILNEALNDFIQNNIQLYSFEPGSWILTYESIELSFTHSHALAEQILNLFSNPIAVNQHQIKISGCIGITQYPLHGLTTKEVLRNADAAMRQAMKDGKQVQFYNKLLTQKATEWLNVEQGMEQAIKNGEFFLNIQPKVSASSSKHLGGEVLIRWQRQGEWVSPAQFIPIAEESGLIITIGEWVLTKACQQWVEWSNQGLDPQSIAINISAQQFIQNEFVELVTTVLHSTGMPPQYLELEITEEVGGQNPEKIIETMLKLKNLGVQLAIDDFGTGYSSLSYLTRFPVDTLKIDRAFVSKMDSDAHNLAIVRMIMSLAKTLNLKVVAEGVETEQQHKMLMELGCDLIQGFYFYKPLSLNDYQQLLTQHSEHHGVKNKVS
jgi:diguanylate cyclase (GGDEF)-like protein